MDTLPVTTPTLVIVTKHTTASSLTAATFDPELLSSTFDTFSWVEAVYSRHRGCAAGCTVGDKAEVSSKLTYKSSEVLPLRSQVVTSDVLGGADYESGEST